MVVVMSRTPSEPSLLCVIITAWNNAPDSIKRCKYLHMAKREIKTEHCQYKSPIPHILAQNSCSSNE